MARVSGDLDPEACLDARFTVNLDRSFSFSIFFLTTSMPTPRPEVWVISAAVENPGCMIKPVSFLVGHAFEFFRRGEPTGGGFGFDAIDVKALPVVGDLDNNVVSFVVGLETNRAGFGFAAPLAVGRRLRCRDRQHCE